MDRGPVNKNKLVPDCWTACHLAAGVQVVEILSDSLTLSETPMTTKVARLMLASDVLHNSTAPVRNASRYRGLLEACLPDVFESMQVGCSRSPRTISPPLPSPQPNPPSLGVHVWQSF